MIAAAQHTPGPWWTTNAGVRDRGGYICHTNPAQHYEGQDERFAQETAERAANKQLIAAAPEMFDALIAVAEVLGSRPYGTGTYRQMLRDRALAAIAKATGNAS